MRIEKANLIGKSFKIVNVGSSPGFKTENLPHDILIKINVNPDILEDELLGDYSIAWGDPDGEHVYFTLREVE